MKNEKIGPLSEKMTFCLGELPSCPSSEVIKLEF